MYDRKFSPTILDMLRTFLSSNGCFRSVYYHTACYGIPLYSLCFANFSVVLLMFSFNLQKYNQFIILSFKIICSWQKCCLYILSITYFRDNLSAKQSISSKVKFIQMLVENIKIILIELIFLSINTLYIYIYYSCVETCLLYTSRCV